MATAGSIVVYLGANTAGLQTGLRRMRMFANGVKTSASGIASSLTSLTIPIALVGAASTKMFSDFESNISKVNGLVGIAKEQTQEWGAEALRMAPEVSRLPNELAEALYFVTSAGIRGANTMEVLRLSAEAAAAGLGKTKDVADIVTSAMNAYGEENLSAAEAVDTLVMSVREGKVEADKFGPAMGKVLPIASAMGVSFNEVGAAIAAMTRTGTVASTSGIQLRQMLFAFQKQSKGAKSAIREVDDTFTHLRKVIREKGLLQGLLRIKQLTDEKGEEFMSKLFPNIRSLVGIIDIMGANLEKNKTLWENIMEPVGALNAATEAASKTFKFQFNQVVAQAASTLIQFGRSVAQTLLPILKKLGEWFKLASDWFTGLDKRTKALIVTVTLVVGAVGPLITVLGFLINSALIPLRIALLAVITPLKAIQALFAANPYVLLAAALIGIGAAFVYIKDQAWAWYLAIFNMWDKVSLLFLKGKDYIIRTFESILPKIIKLINSFLPDNIQIPLKVDSSKMIDQLERDAEIQALSKKIEENVFDFSFAAKQSWDAFKKDASSAFTWVKGIAKDLMDKIPVPSIGEGGFGGANAIPSVVDKTKEARKALQGMAKAALDASDGVNTLDIKIHYFVPRADELQGVFNNLTMALSRNRDEFIAYGDVMEFMENKVNLMNEAIRKIQESGGILTPEQIERLKLLKEELAIATLKLDLMNAAIQSLSSVFMSLGASIGKSMANVDRPFQSLLDSLIGVLTTMGKVLTAAGSLLLFINPLLGAQMIAAGVGLAALGSYASETVKQRREKDKEAANMATGGIVPPGYPNDSFSANLTSKEAVIPLDELWSRLGTMDGMEQKVTLEIDGRKLVGVMTKQRRADNAF
jgi:TP901 family phage tail tape measure protein